VALKKDLPGFERAGSGVGEDGRWTPVFEGQRPPFAPGNDAHLKHGAFASPVRLGERSEAIADALRPYVTAYHPGVEPTLQSYALALARAERAVSALAEANEGRYVATYKGREDELCLSLQTHLRAWLRLALNLASELGLTPSASARILRDAGIGAQAAAAHAELLERYRGAA